MQRAMLNGNPKRTKQVREFIDKDHKISTIFYDFLDEYEVSKPNPKKVIGDMKKLIEKDQDFLDPYSYIAEACYLLENYDEYFSYTYRAYLKALHKVATKDGEYPKQLLWGHIENRHIVRALNNFAQAMWDNEDVRIAIEVYRELLASNPHDNIGARFSILALRMGYLSDYEKLFTTKPKTLFGPDATKLNNWFEKNARLYPEEFTSLPEL